jgi:hypothetical protein
MRLITQLLEVDRSKLILILAVSALVFAALPPVSVASCSGTIIWPNFNVRLQQLFMSVM